MATVFTMGRSSCTSSGLGTRHLTTPGSLYTKLRRTSLRLWQSTCTNMVCPKEETLKFGFSQMCREEVGLPSSSQIHMKEMGISAKFKM